MLVVSSGLVKSGCGRQRFSNTDLWPLFERFLFIVYIGMLHLIKSIISLFFKCNW